MNIIQKFIKNNNLIYKNKPSLNNNFILSKNKNSPLSSVSNLFTKSIFGRINSYLSFLVLVKSS